MFTYNSPYANYDDCIIDISGSGKFTRYDLVSLSEGPITTINLPGYGESETVVAIKDYSENIGMMKFLSKYKLIKRVLHYKPSGFVMLPIVELNLEKIKEMNNKK